MMPILRFIWQMLSYLVIGLVPFLLACLAILFIGRERCKIILFRIDIAVCVIAHGEARTLSGLTGELSSQYKRYHYQERMIDILAYPFDGQWLHCQRSNEWEHKINFNFNLGD